MAASTYKLTLEKTYYKKGFFNLGVGVDKLIRPDSGDIQIFLGEDRTAIVGRVDRKANRNGTPRVFGKGLTVWFRSHFNLMDPVDVVIEGPEQLWLKKPAGDTTSSPITLPRIPGRKQSSNNNDGRNFQRIGSISNTQVGNDFEQAAQIYFSSQGINLKKNHSVSIGVRDQKKGHNFDLGSDEPKIIVECKSHTWTSGDNVPSAKMTVWNEVMFYFFLVPVEYRKILFVLKSYSQRRRKTLAAYYVQTYGHLIPPGVEIMEYDTGTQGIAMVQR